MSRMQISIGAVKTIKLIKYWNVCAKKKKKNSNETTINIIRTFKDLVKIKTIKTIQLKSVL